MQPCSHTSDAVATSKADESPVIGSQCRHHKNGRCCPSPAFFFLRTCLCGPPPPQFPAQLTQGPPPPPPRRALGAMIMPLGRDLWVNSSPPSGDPRRQRLCSHFELSSPQPPPPPPPPLKAPRPSDSADLPGIDPPRRDSHGSPLPPHGPLHTEDPRRWSPLCNAHHCACVPWFCAGDEFGI